MGLAHHTRESWVRTMVLDGNDIVAVQTLRNWIMSAIFLASTAILIALGIFNLAVTADKQGELSFLLNHFGSHRPGLWLAKLLLIGGDFLFTFFNFAIAVRYYNHTSFMINLPLDDREKVDIDDVISVLNRGGLHYTLGMRGYYLAVPLAMWQFGPLWLLAGSILLITVLYRLDRGV